MTNADVNTRFRTISDNLSTAGRWPDTSLTELMNAAMEALSFDCEWPRGRQYYTVGGGVQEYPLEECLKVIRCRVAGQLVPFRQPETMEGDQFDIYDMSGASQQPKWQSSSDIPPVTYPASTDPSTPLTQMALAGQRPTHYIYGGYIGLVPPPANAMPTGVQMELWVVSLPPVTTALGDVLIYPRHFKMSIVRKMMQLAAESDGNDEDAVTQFKYYKDEINTHVLPWVQDFSGKNINRAPMPTPYRIWYNPRMSRGGFKYRAGMYG